MSDRDRGRDARGDLAASVEESSLSPEEAFGLVGNETRMAILRALWDTREPVGFAELRRRAPVETSNFDYHLGKLVGHFVRRTDDGYELRYAGEAVVRAVLAGVITDDPSLEPTVVDAACTFCGSPVEISYADDRLGVRCTECAGAAGGEYPRGTYMAPPFPPRGLEGRTPPEVLEAVRTFYEGKTNTMVDGVCPECAGRVRTTVDVCEEHAPGDDGLCPACDARFRCWVELRCRHCGYERRSALWYRALAQPEVVAAYDHADELRETVPFNKLAWEDPPYIEEISEVIRSRDPLRIQVSISLPEHTLRVTVDDDLDVLEVGE